MSLSLGARAVCRWRFKKLPFLRHELEFRQRTGLACVDSVREAGQRQRKQPLGPRAQPIVDCAWRSFLQPVHWGAAALMALMVLMIPSSTIQHPPLRRGRRLSVSCQRDIRSCVSQYGSPERVAIRVLAACEQCPPRRGAITVGICGWMATGHYSNLRKIGLAMPVTRPL